MRLAVVLGKKGACSSEASRSGSLELPPPSEWPSGCRRRRAGHACSWRRGPAIFVLLTSYAPFPGAVCGSRRTHKGDQPLSVIVHLRFVFYLAGTCHSAASVCGRLRVAFVRRNSSGADHCALGNCLHPLALHAYLRKLGFQRVVCDAPISLQVVSISFYFSQLCRISLSLFFYIAISSITADSCLPLFG